MLDVLWGTGGMAGLLLIAFALSSNRRAIRPRTVVGAFALQLVLGVIVLYWGPGRWALQQVSTGFQAVIDTSSEGISFLFGGLLPAEGEGSIFALQVLPVIIFFASLTAVLYHWRILPWIVQLLGGALGRLLGTGYGESVNTAANIFLGQTEAPLVIRPYLGSLSRSGLFAVMVGGLSTVAGSVLVGYSLLGAPLEYLIAASFMAAPGALLMAKILLPEDDPEAVAREAELVAATTRRKGKGMAPSADKHLRYLAREAKKSGCDGTDYTRSYTANSFVPFYAQRLSWASAGGVADGILASLAKASRGRLRVRSSGSP